MRSDNICFRDWGAIFVDWNWATFGNPLLDLAGGCRVWRVRAAPSRGKLVG